MNINDRRIGRFVIPLDYVNGDAAIVREALHGVIVIEARASIVSDDIEYVGICDAFELVKAGDHLQTYRAVMQKESDGTIKFLRWDSGGADWDFYDGRRLLPRK